MSQIEDLVSDIMFHIFKEVVNPAWLRKRIREHDEELQGALIRECQKLERERDEARQSCAYSEAERKPLVDALDRIETRCMERVTDSEACVRDVLDIARDALAKVKEKKDDEQ